MKKFNIHNETYNEILKKLSRCTNPEVISKLKINNNIDNFLESNFTNITYNYKNDSEKSIISDSEDEPEIIIKPSNKIFKKSSIKYNKKI